ncbi:MAG: bifunctional hydroxymethylpyrimidine kinase/phosphomethylpyrimidine kinase [Legionellaceae bacterium]|nr:bifunctional hydroxymethylpyrimidine kinase/phosphomethylpyrimidine kinase [Legionellaceae bacterium]
MKQNTMPRVLSIAGSDSGGCAGIQADLRVLNKLGCHGSTAITAITAQNTLGVQEILPLSTHIIRQQIKAVMEDIGADAIKIGMLFNEEIIKTIAQSCKKYSYIPIVLDPVCVATSGANLLLSPALHALVNELIPLVTVITPNQFEAELLSQFVKTSEINNIAELLNCTACLITRGDANGSTICDELYFHGRKQPISFQHQKINTTNTHGSGCSLSTAISAYLAMGLGVEEAINQAIRFIQIGIKGGVNHTIGNGPGPLCFK